jgi:outer membrane protein assembly factor BamB
MQSTSPKARLTAAFFAGLVMIGSGNGLAQDWPQWRGSGRDSHVADFKAPGSWPRELIRKWKVTVGEGVATAAWVGDRVFVFSREDGNEITRCLSPADGKELWQEKYEALGATGPAQSFSGPRSSPAVADGRILTLGVRGMLSVRDAANGNRLWRKDDFHTYPNFFTSSSPLILDGLAIAQLGGRENGALVAYELVSGNEKWRWNGPCPSYASPAVLKTGDTKLILFQTETKLVAVKAIDGSLAWESEVAPTPGGPGGGGGGRGVGGGRDYRASSPVVEGEAFIIAGRGVKAVKFAKEGDKFVGRELWNNPDKTVQFNTPVLKDGRLYGLAANNELFCLDAKDGKTLWAAPFPGTPGAEGGAPANRPARDGANYLPIRTAQTVFGQAAPPEPRPPGQGPPGMGGRRGGGMGGGYGSIVDAGSVLFALTPAGQLLVFEPSASEFKQLAVYRVADGQTYAYPVIGRKGILIKDRDALTLWALE